MEYTISQEVDGSWAVVSEDKSEKHIFAKRPEAEYFLISTKIPRYGDLTTESKCRHMFYDPEHHYQLDNCHLCEKPKEEA